MPQHVQCVLHIYQKTCCEEHALMLPPTQTKFHPQWHASTQEWFMDFSETHCLGDNPRDINHMGLNRVTLEPFANTPQGSS